MAIEIEFWLHASDTLRNAGVQEAGQVALKMVRSVNFQQERAAFTLQQKKPVGFKLPRSCNTPDWSDPTDPRMSKIEAGYLLIHRWAPRLLWFFISKSMFSK